MSAYPELAEAIKKMIEKIDATLQEGGYDGPRIRMFLAGGMAVNYWCGTRYTEDVDASFSRRIMFDTNDLVIDYMRQDGKPGSIYFDANYNTSFALMHEDFEQDAVPWNEISKNCAHIDFCVLNPLDLAVSKIARLSGNDMEDILALASRKLISAADLRDRAMEALGYFVGNTDRVKNSIDLVCTKIERMHGRCRPGSP